MDSNRANIGTFYLTILLAILTIVLVALGVVTLGFLWFVWRYPNPAQAPALEGGTLMTGYGWPSVLLSGSLLLVVFFQIALGFIIRKRKKAETTIPPSGQTEVEKALIQSRADFNNLQQKYDKLSEGVGGKRQQFKTLSQNLAELLELKRATELALAEKESEISSLKRVDAQHDFYVVVRVKFDRLTSDNSLTFLVDVFNGSPRRISIERDIKGFILVGDRPLPTKPTIKVVTEFEPPSRLTALTIEQQLTPEIAKSFQDTVDKGMFLQFLFTELDIYMTVEASSEKRKLPLPGGVDCQTGICSNRLIVGKANWTLPGISNK